MMMKCGRRAEWASGPPFKSSSVNGHRLLTPGWSLLAGHRFVHAFQNHFVYNLTMGSETPKIRWAIPTPAKKHVIFLGAGASKTSGYPLATELRLLMSDP